jgi:beta-galactosidase
MGKYLSNPEVFNVNRLEAHSNHNYYLKDENFKKSLNGVWKFSYCNSEWTSIVVPGHMELQGFGAPQYVNVMYPWDGHESLLPGEVPIEFNPYGVYKKMVCIPKKWDKSPIYISFQGVESSIGLYVNDRFVGYSEDTFTPSEFEITDFLVDGENEITAKVYKWCSGSWLEDQDFWRLSGIFRDVYLYSIPEVHIKDTFLLSDICLDDNSVVLKNTLKINYIKKIDINLKMTLLDNNENEIACVEEKNVSIADITLSLNAKNLNLWSAEKPYLYTVLTVIENSKTGEIMECVNQKFGFRKFELIDKIMKINGKRIVFKGVDRHEFNCYRGRAVTEEDMLWDIKFLKANNFNAVRCSHYPNSSRWYELCDEYGIYLIDEVNLETHGTWPIVDGVVSDKVIPNDNPIWLENILDRAKSTFETHKNYASIIIWSCGNESYGGENIYKMSQYFHKIDPSRLVHYEGVFNDRRFNDTSDMESRMYARVWDIEEYLNSNPEKPFILCEYAHSMGNSNGSMDKYTNLAEKYPMYQGGFIWDYIDQAIMKKDENGNDYLAYGGDFNDRPTDYSFCGNGIVFANREATPKVQEIKQLYSDFKITTYKDKVIIKNDSLFTNISEFDAKWKLLHNGVEIIKGTIIITNLPPLSEGEFELNIPNQVVSGEYTVEVTLNLKENTNWAMAGHEITFGQFIYNLESEESLPIYNKLVCIEGEVNIGVKGEGFHLIFSKQYGSLISAKYGGQEFIKSVPRPNFWRAPVENDMGNSMPSRYGQWKLASLYLKASDFKFTKYIDKVEVVYSYNLNTMPKSQCQVVYSVYGDGSFNVTVNYDGTAGLSEMPAFGMTLNIPSEFNNMKWYGMGPDENYTDRACGAKLGIFKTNTIKNLSKYIVPQECGNRIGVRWAEITKGNGNGLKISSKIPFEISALPHTIHEIENARHSYELPKSHCTVLNINKVQMGVGGDDTWGALVHDEYLIPSNEKISFNFKIEPLYR